MQSVQPHFKLVHQLPRTHYPVKILQFGSGNFLRGFADWMLQELNRKMDFGAGVAVVQSISRGELLQSQEGVFTVILKGIRDDEFVSEFVKVDVIQRIVNPAEDFKSFLDEGINPDLQFIISNTTEAGIQFSSEDMDVNTLATSFPGKLTQLLYYRFSNKLNSSLVVLPTELIEQNGEQLKSIILKYAQHWSLPSEFTFWLNANITFCNTLVDRIVSGFPKKPREQVFDELGYKDELVVEAEWFHLWVIEGPRWIAEVLPFRKAGFNVIFTHDSKPYRERKVRILNGAHTSMAIIGQIIGLQSVREAIDSPVLGKFLRRLIYDEIIPHIWGDLNELEKYADEVINRFRNPAIDHKLVAISQQSFSKIKVRVLPSLIDDLERNGHVPERLSLVLASFLFYYRGAGDGKKFVLKDTEDIIELMETAWAKTDSSESQIFDLCKHVLGQPIWGADLHKYPQLITCTSQHLFSIISRGMLETLKGIENK